MPVPQETETDPMESPPWCRIFETPSPGVSCSALEEMQEIYPAIKPQMDHNSIMKPVGYPLIFEKFIHAMPLFVTTLPLLCSVSQSYRAPRTRNKTPAPLIPPLLLSGHCPNHPYHGTVPNQDRAGPPVTRMEPRSRFSKGQGIDSGTARRRSATEKTDATKGDSVIFRLFVQRASTLEQP